MFNIEKDKILMRALKVRELSHILANTNLGQLTVKLRIDEDVYHFLLDAVEFEEKDQKILRNYYDVNQP